jgi:hypothetical protein
LAREPVPAYELAVRSASTPERFVKPDTLRIADTLALPVEAVTQTIGILGAGKTNTAVVIAEEMIRARLPSVIVDPVGVWWGLRSSKDGLHKGLPVYIFGGEQGDIPLDKATSPSRRPPGTASPTSSSTPASPLS